MLTADSQFMLGIEHKRTANSLIACDSVGSISAALLCLVCVPLEENLSRSAAGDRAIVAIPRRLCQPVWSLTKTAARGNQTKKCVVMMPF